MNTLHELYGAFDPVPGPWDLRADESAVVTAERDQQNANPEHATNLRVRAEGSYHDDREELAERVRCGEGACWHWRNDKPCPPDPWKDGPC